MGHENLFFFFFHDSSASVCARMMLALAVREAIANIAAQKLNTLSVIFKEVDRILGLR